MVYWQQGGPNQQVLRWVLLPPPGRRKIPAVKMGLRRSFRASTGPGMHRAGAGRVALASTYAVE